MTPGEPLMVGDHLWWGTIHSMKDLIESRAQPFYRTRKGTRLWHMIIGWGSIAITILRLSVGSLITSCRMATPKPVISSRPSYSVSNSVKYGTNKKLATSLNRRLEVAVNAMLWSAYGSTVRAQLRSIFRIRSNIPYNIRKIPCHLSTCLHHDFQSAVKLKKSFDIVMS